MISDVLVVGVNSQAGITAVKGPPVLNSEERAAIIQSCKWVKECIAETPYTLSEQTLEDYNCKYYIHGDDPCYLENGIEACAYFTEKGRFK